LVEPANAKWMMHFCEKHSIPLKKMIQRPHEFRLVPANC
jgi:hypothetical protein